MISIIIPAHNEAAVIERCLSALAGGAHEGEMEVIVVCNGCTDETAAIAAGCGPMVRVIETSVASKHNALNVGDAAAQGFPRFFVDADVVVPLTAIRRMAEVLADGTIQAVGLRYEMDLGGCDWAVRAFYDVNGQLPTAQQGIGGSGVYALSEEGRRRVGRFPDLTSDDGYVRLSFAPGERRTVEDCCSTVFAPRTLEDLIRIKTRSHFGSLELKKRMPWLWKNIESGNRGALRRLALRPWLWPKLLAYAYVKLEARRRARQRMREGGHLAWERDETSRRVDSPVTTVGREVTV